jgi:hypothetical protein
MTKSGSTFWRMLGGVAFAIFLLASPGLAQTGPFASLAGEWSGAGHILVKDGGREAIRCRATYKVAATGSGLDQVLRCASESYRFDLTTKVTASGDTLSGNWTETGRNINGTLSGRIKDGNIDALVEANGFAASMSMKMNGNKQTVAIRSESTDLRGVDITMTR